MVTIIVGRKTGGDMCRVQTLAPEADEPTYTEFPSKGLSPGSPKWANYVKGVVDKFPGVYNDSHVSLKCEYRTMKIRRMVCRRLQTDERQQLL